MHEPALILARTARLTLRRFQAEDLDAFYAYRTDPEVAHFQPWDAFEREAVAAFVEMQSRALPDARGEWFQVAIGLRETGVLIGDCGIRPLSDLPSIVELGFTLSPRYQRQGYGTEAVGALLTYLFTTPGKHKVIAYTDVENDRSVRLLERVGMTREGTLRENYLVHGRWVDEYLYGLVHKDWARGAPATTPPA